ncbi:sugar ABC transporter substrate-binding protein [Oceanispirochaeta sp.]|uniref:ABC transporter substrate-binding protein n=1 Tax=Oceanispirochaeta sp. TaxID=2035350 RepID=UPI002632AA61|nr:sugar ABC transporter substrate-binding protein [Oceanispirochaeta sp.]MDA3958360.1 sugar ABC transporter substrate-binding protein [Oceanispirochaeta sp.]
MKKLFLVVMVMFVSLQAWGTGSQEPADTKEEMKKEVTLSILWFNDGNESEVFMNTIDDYLIANPHVKVDLQLVPFGDYEKRLKLLIAGGTPPDLARVTNNHVAMFADNLVVLDEKVKNLSAVTAGFNKGSLAFATNKAGKLVALPTEATANGMIVNVDAYAKAGIDIREYSKTWTWDQWYDAMKKVVAANDSLEYGLGFDFSPHRWSTLLYEAGGRFVNEEATAMAFDTPEAVDALKFFKKLHDDKLIPASVWMGSENPQELFQAGIVASHIGGSWVINKYDSDIKDFEWAAVNMPKRKIRSSVAGGKFVGVFAGAENEATAIELMLHFSDQKHNAMYCKETLNLSARTDANIIYPSRNEDFNAMAADLAITPAITAKDWKSPELNKIYSYIREQIIEGLLGNQTMEQTAKNIQDKGNTFF